MTFHNTQNLRLEVEVPLDGLPNLIQNPSGDLGSWGWETPVNNTVMATSTDADGTYLYFSTSAAQAIYFRSEMMPLAAGRYVAARLDLVRVDGQAKGRFEFYDSNKTLLSSSAQSVAWTSADNGGTRRVLAALAPANTAYVALRIDQYNSSGGTPTTLTALRFRRAMVTHAATAGAIQTPVTNLITNPSFETNMNGWRSLAGSVVRITNQAYSGTSCLGLRMSTMSSDGQEAYGYAATTQPSATAGIPVTGGKDYTVSAWTKRSAAGTAYRTNVRIFWYKDATRIGYSDSLQSSPNNVSTWQRLTNTATAPTNANKAFVQVFAAITGAGTGATTYIDSVLLQQNKYPSAYFDGSFANTTTDTYTWNGTAHASTSKDVTSDYDFNEPYTWQNILGPTHNMSIERNDLDVGLLNAEILDAMLDPATADTIRPGKRIRLIGNIDGDWESVYTGKITNAFVTYPRDKRAGSKVKTRIQITASDNIASLSNQGESRGVANIASLPYLLEGKGVPWNVNRSGNQVSSGTVVSFNENASVLDQVAVTRDTALGYAWVDRNNVLNVFDSNQMYTNTKVSFRDDTGLSYSDIDVDFDLDRCINTVNVTWLRYDIGTGQTTEIPYGPYTDSQSVATWGARSATFTIQGATESASAIASYAQSILTANATPVVKANSLTMPVRNAEEFNAAVTLDLYDNVYVYYTSKVAQTYRITSIKHTITPEKWDVVYAFGSGTSVAAPTFVPSPPFKGITQATSWKNITAFENGWGTTTFMRYKIDAANNLHIQGKMDTLGTNGTRAFTLPAGYQPNLPYFLKLEISASTTADNAKANLDSLGQFTVYYTGTPGYVSVNLVLAMD